jgi:hypothetical protein
MLGNVIVFTESVLCSVTSIGGVNTKPVFLDRMWNMLGETLCEEPTTKAQV